MTKWCGDFGCGEFFGAIAFLGALGALGAARTFWCGDFWEQLGATRSNSDFFGGDFGEHSECGWCVGFWEREVLK